MNIATADEILTELLNDATFMSYVGAYHFKSGATADAIAVLASMQEVEGVKKVEGLEVVIPKTPALSSTTAFISGTEGAVAKAWKIFLIQYDSTNNNTVAAADHLICRVPGSDYSVVSSPDISVIAGVEQVVINIPPHSQFI